MAKNKKRIPLKSGDKPKPVSNDVKALTRNEMLMRESMEVLALNATTLRREVLERLLNPGKDINYECGYPHTVSIQEFKPMYDREGLGTRVVDILPDESWAMLPTVSENENSDETEFEKAWKELEAEKLLYHYLHRIDVLSGIGRFGVLLLGINDSKNLYQPVAGIDLKTGKGNGKNKYELLYVKPFDESVVTVDTKIDDPTSPRYGYPEKYSIDFEASTTSDSRRTLKVHWTRIIHVADNRHSSEVFGVPRQKPVYNRLLDVRKILAGSGEMFWKGGFPGYAFEINPDQADVDMDMDTLRTQFENYSQGLQRYIAIAGLTAKSLTPQVADPTGHLKMQLQYIALVLGVPLRKLIGTEESKLTSIQDTETWNKRLDKRRTGYVVDLLMRPFIDRLIAFRTLPEPKEYFVTWPDLNVPSDKDKSEVAKNKTEAFSKYVGGSVDALIPPKEFLTMVMGFTEEEATAIEKAAEGWVGMEEEPEPVPTEVGGGDAEVGE